MWRPFEPSFFLATALGTAVDLHIGSQVQNLAPGKVGHTLFVNRRLL